MISGILLKPTINMLEVNDEFFDKESKLNNKHSMGSGEEVIVLYSFFIYSWLFG